MKEIAFYSATKLAEMIRRGKISSTELLEHYLSRIEKFNPQLNAIITMDVENALCLARQADEKQARGEPLGPLHGVPITIKDGFETAGIRTTSGASIYKDHIPKTNAIAVQRYIDAGAIIIGKTNVPAFCADSQSYNELFGTTNNPWDLERSPGGSSGGAAAAIAAGLSSLELGSDIAGSIRLPASWTGIYGHRPTYGIIPFLGHIPPPPGAHVESDLCVAGPLARSSDDLRLALKILAGPGPYNATGWQLKLPKPRASSLKEYRIAAWLGDNAIPLDDEIKEVLHETVAALRKAGATVDETARPDIDTQDAYKAYMKLLTPIMAAGVSPESFKMLQLVAQGPDKASELNRFAKDATLLHRHWLSVNAKRHNHRYIWHHFFKQYDVLICPTASTTAIGHDTKTEQMDRTILVNGKKESYGLLLKWAGIFTHVHLPSTSAPIGLTKSGLPVGLQIVGPYLEDYTTINFAKKLTEVVGGFEPPPGY